MTPDVEPLKEPKSFAPKKAPQVRQPIRKQRKKPDQNSKSGNIGNPKSSLGYETKVHSRKIAHVVTIEPPSPKKSSSTKIISKKPVPTLETVQRPSTSSAEIDLFSDENIRNNSAFSGHRVTNNAASEDNDVRFKMPNTETFKRAASGRRKPKRTSRGGRIQHLLNETIEDVRKHADDYEALELVFKCVSDEVIENEIKMLEQIRIDVQGSIAHRQDYKKDTKNFARHRLDDLIERDSRATEKYREERREKKMNKILRNAHL